MAGCGAALLNVRPFMRLNLDDESLVKEGSFFIAAIYQNRFMLIRQHLTSEFYNVTDDNGNNLLQIAIQLHMVHIVDFILSLDDFPLNHTNKDGESVLFMLVNCEHNYYDEQLCKIAKKGICLNELNSFAQDQPLLHFFIKKCYRKFSLFLLEMGHNVNTNVNNETPLFLALTGKSVFENSDAKSELICSLLINGADPFVQSDPIYTNFELAALNETSTIQEQLFLYTFDKWICANLHLEVLLHLAENKFPYFYEILMGTNKIIMNSDVNVICAYYPAIFFIELEYLEALSKKSIQTISKCLSTIVTFDMSARNMGAFSNLCERVSIENLSFLIENGLRNETITVIANLNNLCNFIKRYFWFSEHNSLEKLTEQFCFLLSYGYEIDNIHLYKFYEAFGYNNFLRLLLHMDIKEILLNDYDDCLFNFIYNVYLDLESFLECPITLTNIAELLDYFAHPRLRDFCISFCEDDEDAMKKLEKQPHVPLLKELARNCFRKFFVEKYQIQTAKQFFSLLNGLSVSDCCKKIISYETKLY